MKRIILTAIAASFLAVPVAQAQGNPNRFQDRRVEQGHERPGAAGHAWRKPQPGMQRHERGQRYTNWKRHGQVRDWKRHGLRKPGHGQQWIRVGNDYLLISIASGIIAGLLSAR